MRAFSFLGACMNHTYHFTRVSGNSKTGPIPVTTTSKSSCPTCCPLRGEGCYPEYGPLALHWRAVSEGRRGGSLEELCAQIRTLPKRQLWRYGQAGDLPGDGQHLDARGVAKLVRANKGRRGFAYTHYDVLGSTHNRQVVAEANAAGFRVNLSANNLDHADQLMALGIAPVVTLLPADATKPIRTPGGRLVAICPATQRDDIQCVNCGICAKNRNALIGFPAHGTGARKAQRVFFAKLEA